MLLYALLCALPGSFVRGMLPVSAIAQVAARSMQVQIARFLTSMVATRDWSYCHKDRRNGTRMQDQRQDYSTTGGQCASGELPEPKERGVMQFLSTERRYFYGQRCLAVIGLLMAFFLAGCDISFASNNGAISNSG